MFFKKFKFTLLLVLLSIGLTPAAAQFTPQFDLINAVNSNDIEEMKEIFRTRNVTPDVKRKSDGLPILVMAVDKRNYEAVEFLLEKGANVNARYREDKSTALMHAAAMGNSRLVNLLLKYEPDVNMRDSKNESALIKGVRARRTGVVEALIRAGADVNGGDITGKTAMDYARKNGSRRMKNMLEAAGAQ